MTKSYNASTFLLDVEPADNVTTTPTAADGLQVRDPAMTFSPSFEEKTEPGASISPGQQQLTRFQAGCTANLALRGTGDSTYALVPRLGRVLQIAGMREKRITKLSVTGIASGLVIPAGTILTGNTSAAVCRTIQRIVGTGAAQAVHVQKLTTTSFGAAENINGSGLGSPPTTTTISTYVEVPGGYLYTPATKSISTMATTATAWVGGIPADGTVFRGMTSGALGTVRVPSSCSVGSTRYGVFTAVSSTGATPCTTDTTSETLLYFEPEGETAFVANETLEYPSNPGVVVKTLEASLNVTAYQSPTGAAYYNVDGLRYDLKGLRSDFRIQCTTGSGAELTFDATGRLNANTDAAQPSGVTFGDVGAQIRVAQWYYLAEGCVASFTFSMGNAIEQAVCHAYSDGVKNARIVSRRPTIEIDPEAQAFAVQSYLNDLRNWTTAATNNLQYFDNMGTAGNRFVLCATNTQPIATGLENRAGAAAEKVTLACNKLHADGDDEFWIALI